MTPQNMTANIRLCDVAFRPLGHSRSTRSHPYFSVPGESPELPGKLTVCNGKPPFSIGKYKKYIFIHGGFSIAMLDYRGVAKWPKSNLEVGRIEARCISYLPDS